MSGIRSFSELGVKSLKQLRAACSKKLRGPRQSPNSRLLQDGSIDPRYNLYRSARRSALLRHIEWSITKEDILAPKFCKYTGMKLDYTVGNIKARNKATVDRIDSSKGYIPGNIQVISYLANTMKNDATVKEMIMFAKGILRVYAPRCLK